MTAPSTDLGEIVTSTEPPVTAEQMLAEFTPEEIAEVGGQKYAGELASIYVAWRSFVGEQDKTPESLDDLAGYLDQTIDLWVEQDGALAAGFRMGGTSTSKTPRHSSPRHVIRTR